MHPKHMTKKARGVAALAIAYAVAIAVAVGVGYALRGQHPLVMIAAADVAGTVVIFLFSAAFNNSSFYDPYWTIAPMVIVAFWVVSPISEGVSVLREIVAGTLVWLWGARLTLNFLRGWTGLEQEDWRYVNIRRETGRMYWPVSFLGIHLVPTILVYLGCLSLYPVYTATGRPFGLLDAIAAAITLVAVAIEALADNQLRRFAQCNPEPGSILDTGLWRYSRHPNYFGEVLFWWGLFAFAMASDPARWWTVAGPASILLLFVFISIPLIDKRHLERRPAYREHMQKTSALIPWPPKNPR